MPLDEMSIFPVNKSSPTPAADSDNNIMKDGYSLPQLEHPPPTGYRAPAHPIFSEYTPAPSGVLQQRGSNVKSETTIQNNKINLLIEVYVCVYVCAWLFVHLYKIQKHFE